MLARRIIACLDCMGEKVVKGVKFKSLKVLGDAVRLAKFYEKEKVDEIVMLDINASVEHRKPFYNAIEKVASSLRVPFTAGGGVRTFEDFKKMFLKGADKVSINTGAIENPEIIRVCSEKFGSQSVVVAIDVKKEDGSWKVYSHSGKKPAELDVIDWIKEVQNLGAGEILLTSIDRDGTKEGYDLDLLEEVKAISKIPVIASGGAGKLEHFYTAIKCGADAVLLASLLHEKIFRIVEIKNYLRERGINVRI
jgi:cyclase